MNELINDRVFEKVDFGLAKEPMDYEDCQFTNCKFADKILNTSQFTACRFIETDLSNADLTAVGFQDVTFEKCKMIGLNFARCVPFLLKMDFTECNLEFASFYGIKLSGAKLVRCILKNTDFSAADFSRADFRESNLAGANFDGSNLALTDFSLAKNFIIDPAINQIKGARFSLDGLPGLLMRHKVVVVDNV